MLKRFVRDSAVYGIAAVLSRGISFVLVPLYTRVLAPSDYGMVDILSVFASLINLTVALEISQAVARHYPDAPDERARRRYASTALWFTVGAYGLFGAVAMMIAPRLSAMLLDSPERVTLIRLALGWIVAYGLFYLVQNQLRWELKPVRYAAASLTMTAVTLLLAVLLVGALRLGVRGVVTAQLGGSAAGAMLGFYLARETYRPLFDWAKCREMLRFSVPLVPSSVAVFVALYIDRIAIKQLMTLGDVGLFGVGYRVAAVAGLLMVAFQGALIPLVYTYHRDPQTPQQLARIFRYFVAFALSVCVGLSLFAGEALRAFTSPKYYAAAAVVPLLAPAVLLSNMYIFAPGLAIAKRTGTVAILNAGGAVLNTVLNFALIPHLGIVGAALATFVSAGSVFTAYMLTSQRLYPVPHRWGKLLAAGAVAVAAVGGTATLHLGSPLAILAKALVLGASALLFVRLGLVGADELRRGVGHLRRRAQRLAA